MPKSNSSCADSRDARIIGLAVNELVDYACLNASQSGMIWELISQSRRTVGFEFMRNRGSVKRTFVEIGPDRRQPIDDKSNPHANETQIQFRMIQLTPKKLEMANF